MNETQYQGFQNQIMNQQMYAEQYWPNVYPMQDMQSYPMNPQAYYNPTLFMPQMMDVFQYTTTMPSIVPPNAVSYAEFNQRALLANRYMASNAKGYENWTSEQGSEPMNHKRPLYEMEEPDPSESKKMKLTTEVSPMSKFQKEHCCGHGTFGKVWAAKEISTGRTVALKQIKLSGNEGFPRTAIREIIIMKKHVHSNILSIEEVVWAQEDAKDDFEVYLVMDYYNYDLRKLLEKHQLKFNSSEVKYLFRQLAEGVAYLHKNILMHRDLKTENILINTTGHLKICDFGLSRAFNPEGRMKTYTPVVITLWYRPPELLLGPCAYSCEVDQWSVGCIFAELLRSAVLFAGNSDIDQADKIFAIMGSPSEATWPEYMDLPGAQKTSFRSYPNRLRTVITPDLLSSSGFDLLTKLLNYRPEDRITAAETLNHPYFSESPNAVQMINIDNKVIAASKNT